jgi:hypothetical protein
MQYKIQGTLRANLSSGIDRPLADVTVQFYETAQDERTVRAVAARSKESFRTHETASTGGLLGSATTDADGDFAVTVGETGEFDETAAADYDGGAVRFDLLVTSVDGHEGEPFRTTLTTEQPRWGRSEEEDRVAPGRLDHTLSEKEWCYILEELGVWVVTGRVTDRESGDPLRNLTVTAYDADIIQSDELGSATTGPDGGYAIYYRVADFEAVPAWWTPGPIELQPGPDVYVTVANADGVVVEAEPAERGRDPGRENVGPCARVDIELDLTPGPGDPALFTGVGPFDIATDIESDGTIVQSRRVRDSSGRRVGGAGWGFTGRLELRGYVPQTDPDTGAAMWYRFLYETDAGERPVVGNLLSGVTVGERFDGFDGAFRPLTTDIVVDGSGGGPGTNPGDPDVYVPTSGNANDAENGWIPVVRTGGPGLLGDGYGPNLLGLDTTELVPGGTPSTPAAGSAPAASETGGTVRLVFETTVDDGSGAPSTDPADVERRGEATIYVNNWREVRELAVVDDIGNEIGCSVTDTATVRYTVDHEFLTEYGVGLTSPAAGGGSAWPGSLLSGSVARDTTPHGSATGVAGEIDLGATYDGSGSFDAFTDWPACSYIARLSSRLALTDGRRNDVRSPTRAEDGVFYKQ